MEKVPTGRWVPPSFDAHTEAERFWVQTVLAKHRRAAWVWMDWGSVRVVTGVVCSSRD